MSRGSMDIDGKKILITGGSGFIGQNLAKRFLSSGQEVCILDIREPDSDSLKKIYLRGDIFDTAALEKIVKDYDVAVHLVGLADSWTAQREPMKSFNLNILSLQNVLEACRGKDGKKIIFPSSAAVYGITEDLPIKENFRPRPTNIYSWHKYLCEEMLKAYGDNYGIEYVVLRLFNVYGAGNKGVIDAFLSKAQRGEVIESYGPRQYRDFVYAGDVAEAMYHAAMYEKVNNRIVNIGSGKGIQIREILEMVCEMYPKAKWVEKKEKFTMYDSIADITLARILLDFNPHDSKEFMKEIIRKEMI